MEKKNEDTGKKNLNERLPKSNTENNIDDTDKYLAMEQPGVTYTKDDDTVKLSDSGSINRKNRQQDDEDSEYSNAYSQDDYVLQDNIDLDEDQNQSISSDDDDFEETNERY